MLGSYNAEADGGVGSGPGGPPHIDLVERDRFFLFHSCGFQAAEKISRCGLHEAEVAGPLDKAVAFRNHPFNIRSSTRSADGNPVFLPGKHDALHGVFDYRGR